MKSDESPPASFSGEPAWVAADLHAHSDSWIKKLNQDEVNELQIAAHTYLSTGKDIGEITANDFPLPSLTPYVASIKKKLLSGYGVEVVRGLPVSNYSLEEAACIFCGIGAHLGSARSQNAKGHILGHVRDVGLSSNDANTRIYQTAERQSFHTDSADVVGLMCLQEAKAGGESLLVSALAIYNRMRKLRPDLLELLFQPIATDRRGEVPEGEKPYMEIPVLNWYKGFLTVFYQRQYINSAQRFDGVSKLTVQQIEALDLFDSLANDPELHIGMQLHAGDMQFVYNHSQLHDRTAFEDWPELERRRHMLRLWLSIEGDRPLPEYFKQRYGSIKIEQRGGIITSETQLHAPLTIE